MTGDSKNRYKIWFLFFVAISTPLNAAAIDLDSAREWIIDMKESERGPFERIRWFCNDGSVLPVNQGCSKRGGGIQHGELNERAQELRAEGFPIANVYASLSDQELTFIAQSPLVLATMLLERYLMLADDGWIFRRARFYRGAYQVEDEAQATSRLVSLLHREQILAENHFLLLREASRLLFTEKDLVALTEARAIANQIFSQDQGFSQLRNKLHSLPEPSDIERIREYSENSRSSRNNVAYLSLISKLEQVFQPVNLYQEASILVPQLQSAQYRKDFTYALSQLQGTKGPLDEFWALADLIYYTRKNFAGEAPIVREKLMLLSLQTERTLLRLWSSLSRVGNFTSRQNRLQILLPLLQASYGTGLLSERAYQAAAATVNELLHAKKLTLGNYFTELRYLTRIPGWASGEMMWEFGAAIDHMHQIEEKATGYIPDRLRSSLFSVLSNQLEFLISDVSKSAGMVHNVAGIQSSIDVKALNQGLARGILAKYDHTIPDAEMASRIIVTADTEASLPPVAGILTLNDGNSLSHVQLLARNFGIPNAVISQTVADRLESYMGTRVVLAVSPAGRVELRPDSEEWNQIFEAKNKVDGFIDEDADQNLKLSSREILSLEEVDADDSGRKVGPKAARLGELKQIFPNYVSSGMVLPFGIYRGILEHKMPSGETLFDWINGRYGRLKQLPQGSSDYEAFKKESLQIVRETFTSMRLSEEFRSNLWNAFSEYIGDPDHTGVFVRSDTNVEDLPKFTGAGLNLTEPNVIGFNNIIASIQRVWASPFEERSFAWRQDRMLHPENVFVSILLQRTVPNEKSGVIITADLEHGNRDSFTVAVNRGLTGAVNNQQAEVVVVHRPSGNIKLLSEASAHTMKIVNPAGGLKEVTIQTRARILSPSELEQLDLLVEKVEKKYRSLMTSSDRSVPMDIEFGFAQGKLALFQIRPFVESVAAKQNRHLIGLDSELKARFNEPITLTTLTM